MSQRHSADLQREGAETRALAAEARAADAERRAGNAERRAGDFERDTKRLASLLNESVSELGREAARFSELQERTRSAVEDREELRRTVEGLRRECHAR